MKVARWMAVVLMAVAGGCYSSKGETVLKYDKGGAAHMMRAPGDGEYELVRGAGEEKGEVVKLRRGEMLGFKKYQDGGVVGVAGAREIPLKEGEGYRWRRE